MKFKQPIEGGTGSKHFVKLKDKESIRGIFRGEPYDFRQHWVNDRSVLCTAPKCAECDKGTKSVFRFRVNFVMKEGEGYVAKIFEQSFKVYEVLRSLHEGGYDLEKNVMQITRSGSGQQTNYTIMPIPNGSVSPSFEKTISEVKLHDLVNLEGEKKPTTQSNDEFDANDDIPF